jgi:hypothetical protein
MYKIKYAETVLKWSSGRNWRENCMKAKGDYQVQIHSDQMVLVIVRRGGWINWAMAKGNSRGAIRLKTTQMYGSRDGLAGRLDCVSNGQKMLKKILKQGPKSGRLYSLVTHNTCKALHVPGSSCLDLVGLWLLVRKWGPILTHPIRDAPRGSRLVWG